MKKHLKKLVLGTLSAGLVLAVSPMAIFATEEATSSEETTEETVSEEVSEESAEEDLTPSEDNPYTEAEITELIKPAEEWDPNLVLAKEDFETAYEEVLTQAKERSENGETNLTSEEVIEIMGAEPTNLSETDNGEIFRYVSIEDDIVQILQFQTYLNSEERGEELVNIEYQYKTAKMFERLETTVEDLQVLYDEGDLQAFNDTFGHPQIVTTNLFVDRYTETLMWSVVGNEEVEEGEVAAIELEAENGEVTNIAYYEQESAESDSEEVTDEETTDDAAE